MTVRRYASAPAFKQALERRLRDMSSSGSDFGRRRQLLVFDRFLARVSSALGDSVILKGGFRLPPEPGKHYASGAKPGGHG